MLKSHETLDKVGLLRSLEPKDLAVLERRCHLATRSGQAMAAGAGRCRHRHLFPDQRRRARADHAGARSRDHPGRHQRRRLFRRDGRDRRPAALRRASSRSRTRPSPACRRACSARFSTGIPTSASSCSSSSWPAFGRWISGSMNSAQCMSSIASTPSCCGVRGPIRPTSGRRWSRRRRCIRILQRVSATRREMVARELKALERAGLLTKRRGAFVITNVPQLMQKLHSE